jgi:hypothetical protein
MQTLLHVYCAPGRSLREAIARDARLDRFHFEVVRVLQQGRAPGWTKLRSTAKGRRGSLNLEWNAAARVLQCRIVNRGAGRAHLVVGDFLDYLLARFRRRVRSIVIVPG